MTEKQKKVVAKQVRKLEEVYALHEKDREVLHICADEVLLEALVELGFFRNCSCVRKNKGRCGWFLARLISQIKRFNRLIFFIYWHIWMNCMK